MKLLKYIFILFITLRLDVFSTEYLEGDGTYHALQNLEFEIEKNISKQIIINVNSNINKRLNYFRMLKFNSKTNNFNIKNINNSDTMYYEDYYTKPYYINNIWYETSFGEIEQVSVKNDYGYDNKYVVETLGYDIRISNNFIFGTSYTLNIVNAKDKDPVEASKGKFIVTAHNGDLYAMIYKKSLYLALNLGAGYNRYEQERNITFIGFDETAKSDYNSLSYYFGGEFGFNWLIEPFFTEEKIFKPEKSRKKNTKLNKEEQNKIHKRKIGVVNNFIMLTPKLSAILNSMKMDSYTESGAGIANLLVKEREYKNLETSLGIAFTINREIKKDVSWIFITDVSAIKDIKILTTDLEANYIYDERKIIISNFESNKLIYNFGAFLNFNFYESKNIGIQYNYIFSKNMTGNFISLKFLLSF